MNAPLYSQYKEWLRSGAHILRRLNGREKMRFKLIIAILITASGLTAAPQALDKFSELRMAVENWTRLNLVSGVLAASAHEKESAERALFEPRSAKSISPVADDFRWSGRVASGRTVEIKGVNGDIRAEPSSGTEVEVVANKHAKRSNPAEVQIKVIEHEGGVTICAIYPSGDPGRVNDCQVGNHWSSHTRDNDVAVDFSVRLPAGLTFDGRTVNGNIETGNLLSDAEVQTVNGDISVKARGYAIAKTVNGNIEASVGSVDWPAALSFQTVNGNISLNLPAATTTAVTAETLNGEVSTDFPMTVQGHFSRRRLNGTIADGKYHLTVKTVNGNISLRRAQ